MRLLTHVVLCSLCVSSALAQPQLPRDRVTLPPEVAARIERQLRAERPAPPSEISGYIVSRDAHGALRPTRAYPQINVRFAAVDRPDPVPEDYVFELSVHNAASGLRPVRTAAGTVAWGYRIGLSADRLAGTSRGYEGLQTDPERPNSIRFNPDRWRYLGIEVTMHERVIDPNTGRDVGSTGVGVARATSYEDTSGFTR
ncbi:MAG: hypothetical protein H7124_02710 [Phycisphaerales bacterium]|nr:hypothetical protein [Hyphomonadaceae bacterium]